MRNKVKLSKAMTVDQFETGYWYSTQIKAFAKDIGISFSSKLRKDELEVLIKHFLRTGEIKPAQRKNLSGSGTRDIDKGLNLMSRVVNFTNDKQTKEFIVDEALMIDSQMKEKSGARYRLNRWREDQIEKGIEITYGDLVRQYIRLNNVKGSFPQAPAGRYINFVADFLSQETGATRQDAVNAWKALKKLPVRKNYNAWKEYQGLAKSQAKPKA